MDERIQQLLRSMGRGGGGAPPMADQPLPDTAEKIQISSLSLLKMLKHGEMEEFCYRIVVFVTGGNYHL